MQIQSIEPNDKFESLDDGSFEETPENPCSVCQGDGQVFSQDDMNDEEDKDIRQCTACGGSGFESDQDEEDEDYSFLDED